MYWFCFLPTLCFGILNKNKSTQFMKAVQPSHEAFENFFIWPPLFCGVVQAVWQRNKCKTLFGQWSRIVLERLCLCLYESEFTSLLFYYIHSRHQLEHLSDSCEWKNSLWQRVREQMRRAAWIMDWTAKRVNIWCKS